MAQEMLDALHEQVGKTYVSDWIKIDQPMIDAFADTTRDWNFLHVDAVKAAEAGYGGTIAHGFLTLSLLAPMRMASGRPPIEGFRAGVNYGLEKVRMLAPVPSGSRLRGHFRIDSLEETGPGKWREAMQTTVEIEGEEKPALVASWLTMYLL